MEKGTGEFELKPVEWSLKHAVPIQHKNAKTPTVQSLFVSLLSDSFPGVEVSNLDVMQHPLHLEISRCMLIKRTPYDKQ